MDYKVLPTSDGSNTLFSSEFNASYHSMQGAIEESQVVFINLGLKYLADQGQSTIRIFEMGFGTGLNAALSIQYASKRGIGLKYCGVEAFPVPFDIMQEMGYNQLFSAPGDPDFEQLHKLAWDQEHRLDESTTFTKLNQRVQDFKGEYLFDLIYFDAFAPQCQPELWSEEVLSQMYKLLDRKGVLTTYCAKGSFKRSLKKVGFQLENHPGPGRKREITRAIKCEE